MSLPVDIVVPTVGRPSLALLVDALREGSGPPAACVVVVDDRRSAGGPLRLPPIGAAAGRLVVLRGGGRGPAAARNAGWRAGGAPWVAFLDDDVVPVADWRERLRLDLRAAGPDVAGSQGAVIVPRARGRRPTDRERAVIGLETAAWATADMAYRRETLLAVGGFDERFPAAYREDADLALRVMAHGGRLVRGDRRVHHPVAPAGPWASVRAQRGNRDDVLMRALHGRDWRRRAAAPPGRRPRHLAIVGAALGAAAAAAAGRRGAAGAAGAAWLAGTAELAASRIAAGPRTAREVATMAATSVAIPFAAAWHTARGVAGLRGARADRRRAPRPLARAVLLDRDGTLVVDVPYNGDPDRVRPVPGAGAAIARLRGARIPTAVVSNQSGVARGLLSIADVAAVNRRVDDLLGGLGPWLVCAHGPADGCGCRKPEPGLVLEAARRLGVEPGDCVVVGDIGADVEAAAAAGARAVLVPTPATRPDEIARAPVVAPDLATAVDLVLGGRV